MHRTRRLYVFVIVALLISLFAVPTGVVYALTTIFSANGNPWEVSDITEISDSGAIFDGGQDAFDWWGAIRIHVEDGVGGVLVADQQISDLDLTWDGFFRSWSTTKPGTYGGVQVGRALYAPPGTDYMRYIDTFSNTSGATRQVQVVWGGNLGSDFGTTLSATSTGGLGAASITLNDTWAVTIENAAHNPNGPASDPPVGYAWGTSNFLGTSDWNAVDPFTTAWPGNMNDWLGYRFSFTLAPGQSASLAYFLYRGIEEGTLGPGGQPAPGAGVEIAKAMAFLSGIYANPAAYFTDLSATQKAQIINWNLAGAAAVCAQEKVGPAGGTVGCGPWTVTVLSGTLAGNSLVTIREEENAPGSGTGLTELNHTIKVTISTGDSKLTSFNPPLWVCYRYTSKDVVKAGGNPGNLVIGTAPNQGTGWSVLATSLNTSSGQICANATHLSLFDAFIPALPATGFAPGRMTLLPEKPAGTAYSQYGDIWLEIPRLGVQATIVGIPLTGSGWDVTWLSNQIGYLQGTAFPTWTGNSVLTAHVYQADGQPGPFVDLYKLWWGDRVVVHAFGQQYIYQVREIKRIAPDALSTALKHEELPWLTLLTCKGYDEESDTYQYRLVVRAVLVEVK